MSTTEQDAVSSHLRGTLEPREPRARRGARLPDFINYEAPPGRDRGPESMRGLATMLLPAFPDLYFTIEEVVAEGDIVAGRLTMSGNHEGPLMDTPPTGRFVRQEYMHFVRFRDGKAIEHWGLRDELGMMQQLSVVPEARQPGRPEPS